jgi:hypothetical protein
MGFRERPEYQGWREAVFQRFGQKCIRCGHAGNIHAHHVMPVEDYPELAFEPTNGVPLCGNCHVAIKGDELSHADELKGLQRAIVEGETAGGAKSGSTEAALRESACAEPSNEKAVGEWFEATADSKAVVDFWERHHDELKTSVLARHTVLRHLLALSRWEDVISEANSLFGAFLDMETAFRAQFVKAKGLAEAARRETQEPEVISRQVEQLEGVHEQAVEQIERTGATVAAIKGAVLTQIGQYTEAVAFLQEMVVRLPEFLVIQWRNRFSPPRRPDAEEGGIQWNDSNGRGQRPLRLR